MEVLKIKIRVCEQCRSVLPKKCTSCVKHPKRVPRLLYIYDMPQVLQEGTCGNCVLITCENKQCGKKFWRTKNTAAKYDRCFCNILCAQRQAAADRDKRRPTLCSSIACDRGPQKMRKLMLIPQNRLKRVKNIYCSPECHYIHATVLAAERHAEAKRRATDQSLKCYGKHRGAITTHLMVKPNLFECAEDGCGTRRDATVAVGMTGGALAKAPGGQTLCRSGK